MSESSEERLERRGREALEYRELVMADLSGVPDWVEAKLDAVRELPIEAQILEYPEFAVWSAAVGAMVTEASLPAELRRAGLAELVAIVFAEGWKVGVACR